MITEFAKALRLNGADLLDKKSRTRRITDARHLYWRLLRREGFTLSDIGTLSGYNHATVLMGIRSVEGLLRAGDDLIKLWDYKTRHIKRHMSKEHIFIEVAPPEHLGTNGGIETRGDLCHHFKCPSCGGHGHFFPKEVGRNEYEDVICKVCAGTGRLRANIVIKWFAPNENPGYE
jgi:hypothetical protein